MVVAILAAIVGGAFADQVQTDVGTSVSGSTTITSGGSAGVDYWIQPTGSTCDAADGSPVTVTINTPSDVSVVPSSLNFNTCHDGSNLNAQEASFSSTHLGSNAIPVVSVSDSSGSYGVNNTDFALKVNPRPATSLTAAANGSDQINLSWGLSADNSQLSKYVITRSGGSTGTILVDPPASAPGAYSDTGLDASTEYCYTIKARYTDATNTNFDSTLYPASGTVCATTGAPTPSDTTPPSVQAHVTPAPNADGWNNTTPVDLTWTITDGESATSIVSGCNAETFTSETAGATRSCTASSAGGTTGPVSVPIKIDATKPVVSADTGAYSPGTWTNEDVNVAFSCADTGSMQSNIKTDTVGGDTTVSSDSATTAGTDVTSTGNCVDYAGNPATAKTVNVKLDKSAPEIKDDGFSSGTAGSNGWYVSAVENDFSASDGLSGLDSTCASAFPKTVSSGTEEGSAVKINSGGCSDNATNLNSGLDSAAYKIDLSDPTVTCPTTAPTFLASQLPATVTATVTDSISGPASTTATGQATNANGGTVSITGYDKAGRSTTVSCAYHVASTTFLSPIDSAPALNIAKLGRVVPVKNTITYDGSPIGNGSTVYVGGYSNVNCSMATTTDDLEVYAPAGSSNTGNLFRWDSTGQNWIYNYDTSAFKMQAGNCYRINVYYGGTVSNGSASGGVLVGYFLMKTTK
jgi:hypothetical protein